MNRLILNLALILTLTLTLFVAASPEPVSAEAGCSISTIAPYHNGSYVSAGAVFQCAGSDLGNRQIQACVINNGVWQDCDTAYTTGATGSVSAECHRLINTVATSQVWYWFYGEDGVAISGYGQVNRNTNRCDYGVD